MWRGFTLDQFTNQCFSNDLDLGRGRQMPVHYGSKALQYHTVSSPLGTQLPQAVGVAYRLKLAKKPNVAFCFFGDGCASTTDFHSAMNFAATLKAPVVFFCRNNGYAISTPVTDQYAGDGIISRAPGYGMAAIRVDVSRSHESEEETKDQRELIIRVYVKNGSSTHESSKQNNRLPMISSLPATTIGSTSCAVVAVTY